MAEIPFTQKVHTVIVQPTILSVAHQHRVIDRRNLNTNTRQNLGIIFHILANFQNCRIFQHSF